jgi:methylphosphotriester-DNA--protein-cysteine methyltransferase
VDRGVSLPEAVRGSFWLDSSAWQVPDYENVEVFVSQLIRAGLLVIDPTVTTALRGELSDVSPRTVQRRFRRATGLTHSAAQQIERARFAALLLMRGVPIVDATNEAGYFDQPHLTRSFKRLIGQTPTDVQRNGSGQLSFLYKTEPFASP